MSGEALKILKNIITNFSLERFELFFRRKTSSFRPTRERLSEYEDEDFTEGIKLGEIKFEYYTLWVCAFKVKQLTERSSKKKQYEKAKRVLKENNVDAGIFIFYDGTGNFRFSLIYAKYLGERREFSYYKRYTYFVSPSLTNKTFLKQVGEGDFSSLEGIKKAFSVEPVTEQFYKEIRNWYFWAMDKVWFPEDYKYSQDPEKDKEIRTATNLIRLITRLIFIWFLKEKGLVPEYLFDKEKLKNIVKDFGKSHNYYNAILQNLFFATLNQKMEERRFAKDEDYLTNRKEYGVKTLFRYKDKFLISEEEVLKLFEDIPFLNGGLFECLDKEDENGRVIYIDGFSRNPKKQAKIPDYLFFQEKEETVDLSKYGLGEREPVRGLIEILKSYNFTVDEATPIDQEIALDPELLGKVFENLLASYNPETSETARKSTGSYYTPREIVDYMVDESLKEYFKTTLPEISPEKIELLLSYSDEVPEFSQEEKKRIVYAIDRLKIIDPACGSGAFPMGILHKLVHILQKIDPENEYWYELQYEKAVKQAEEAFMELDKEKREELLKEINDSFDESINYPDYARKLYLIENCIYGVDIQPIATQLSKLRFFISLLIDQKVDRSKKNFGIKPLPNLETNIVCANTLVGLKKPNHIFYTNEIKKLEEEIKRVRHRYFTAKTREEKLRLQREDRELRKKLKEKLKAIGFPNESSEKIANFDPYDQNASTDWFDPEWMFGITEGFDIVIGNPPYIRQEKIKDLKPILQSQGYEVYTSTADIYVYFYEQGYKLLKDNGVLSYITSNKWMRAKYGENLRKFLKEKTTISKLIDFSGYRVFEQTVDTCILLFRKSPPPKRHIFEFLEVKSDVQDLESYLQKDTKYFKEQGTGRTVAPLEYWGQIETWRDTRDWQTMYQDNLTTEAWTLADEKVLALKQKIEKVGKPLREWNVRIYRGVLTGYNEAFIIDTETRNRILANCKDEEERKRTEEIIKPVLRGRDIEKWHYKWAGLWIICTFPSKRINIDEYPALKNYLASFGERLLQDGKPGHRKKTTHKWFETQDNIAYYKEFEKEKVVWQEIVREPSFAYDNTGIYIEATGFIMTGKNLKYLLALLNSRPVSFFFRTFYAGGGLGEKGYRYKKAFLEDLPIPPITSQNQHITNQIVELVDRILSNKNQNPSADISHLEKQIDQLVYKLYDLTDEEIKIIEGQHNE